MIYKKRGCLLNKKYVIFKDDDAGKDLPGLKKWVDVVLSNNAKGCIGLIGRYLKKDDLRMFLKSLDSNKIEVFCHGYSHRYLPFMIHKIVGRNRLIPIEFDKDATSHDLSLKKYRSFEKIYLDTKTVTFGPPGNIWNDSVIQPLIKNDFKIMFSSRIVGGELLTIPVSNNLKGNSLDDFIENYEKNKKDVIYTLQFHHATLSEEQFKLMAEVISFLKNDEKRVFVTPSEILKISKKDKELFNLN